MDTRNVAGPLGGPGLLANQTRAFPLLTGQCGLPVAARSYSLNVTVVPKGPVGFLTMWPTGVIQPVVATVNDVTGTIVGNAAIVPSGTNGSVNVFVTDATDVVVDVNGYFAAPGSGGEFFFPVTPCRVEDTRLPNGSPPTGSAASHRDECSHAQEAAHATKTPLEYYALAGNLAPPQG